MDDESGSVRFRICIDCEDMIPSEAVVRNGIYCTAAMMKSYATGILDIVYGGCSAEEAFDKCEF